MFQNAFQGGSHVDIFDAKVNKDKEKTYAQLYRMTTPQGFSKIYDKDIKGYIYSIDGHSTKMRFPKDDKLDLWIVQGYLVMQIYLPYGSPWSLEIGISDTSKVNRRINLVSALNKIETKYFHVKVPNDIIKRGIWMNLSIDVNSFMDAWKGKKLYLHFFELSQTFRSIDNFTIGSSCKLRRVFSMKNPIFESNSDEGSEFIPENIQSSQTSSQYRNEDIPKNFAFPNGFPYTSQIINYQKIMENVDPKYLESVEQLETVKIGGTTHQKTLGGKGMMLSNNTQSKSVSQKSVKSVISATTSTTTNEKPQFDIAITQDFKDKSMTTGMILKSQKSPLPSTQQKTQLMSQLNQNRRDLSASSSHNLDEEFKQENTHEIIKNRQARSQSKESQSILKQNRQKSQGLKVSSSTSKRGGIPRQPINTQDSRQSSKSPLQKKQITVTNNLSPKNPWNEHKEPHKKEERNVHQDLHQLKDKRQLLVTKQQNEEYEEEEIEERLEGEYAEKQDQSRNKSPFDNSANKKEVSKTRTLQNPQKKEHKETADQEQIHSKGGIPVQDQKRAIKSASSFGQKHNSSMAKSKGTKETKKGKEDEKKEIEDTAADYDGQEYFQLTQKFNTLTDQQQFRDCLFETIQKKTTKKEEIEEDIEFDNMKNSSNFGKKKEDNQKDNMKSKNSLQKVFPSSQQSQPKPKEKANEYNYEDSLEIPYEPDLEEQKINTKNESKIEDKPNANTKNKQINNEFANYNIFENHLSKFIHYDARPFTPPFNSVAPLTNSSVISNKQEQSITKKSMHLQQNEQAIAEEERN